MQSARQRGPLLRFVHSHMFINPNRPVLSVEKCPYADTKRAAHHTGKTASDRTHTHTRSIVYVMFVLYVAVCVSSRVCWQRTRASPYMEENKPSARARGSHTQRCTREIFSPTERRFMLFVICSIHVYVHRVTTRNKLCAADDDDDDGDACLPERPDVGAHCCCAAVVGVRVICGRGPAHTQSVRDACAYSHSETDCA